jgi:hypothetical protein
MAWHPLGALKRYGILDFAGEPHTGNQLFSKLCTQGHNNSYPEVLRCLWLLSFDKQFATAVQGLNVAPQHPTC